MTDTTIPQSPIQLRGIRLRRALFEVLSEVVAPAGVSPPQLQVQVRERRDEATRQMEVDVQVWTAEPTPAGTMFRLDVTMSGLFFWTDTLPAEYADFGTRGAPAIVWPFLREVVAGLTSRAGLPAVYLPLMNFAALRTAPAERASTSESGLGSGGPGTLEAGAAAHLDEPEAPRAAADSTSSPQAVRRGAPVDPGPVPDFPPTTVKRPPTLP